MLLLVLRLDNDLKLEFENNFENDLVFVENMISFMDAIKNRKYEAIVIDERNSKEEALISLITKITELQKKGGNNCFRRGIKLESYCRKYKSRSL